MRKIKREYEVIIVGAGPTGLVLANLLEIWGVDFLLIDQKESPTPSSKAFGIHARSLEVFHQIGVVEEFLEKGKTDNTVHIHRKGKPVVDISIQELLPGETLFPYFLILPQNHTETILANHLENRGGAIHWQHQLKSFHEGANGVQAVLEHRGEIIETRAKFLVGCDGANSTIRQGKEIPFPGRTYSPAFFLADVKVKGEVAHGDIYFLAAPQHLSLMFSFPEPDSFRIFNFVNEGVDLQEGEKLTLEMLKQILHKSTDLDINIDKLEWSSVFKIHSRVAENFAKGPILLAGDAAHIHSPVGGQGMNTGIQDAHNLAWKISFLLKGLAKDAILHTYQEERKPIARNLHWSTDLFFLNAIKKNVFGDLVRLYLMPTGFALLTRAAAIRKGIFRRVSQLAIKYRFGSFNRNSSKIGFLSPPLSGDRAPLASVWLQGAQTTTYDLMGYRHFTLFLAVKKAGKPLLDLLELIQRQEFPIKVFLVLKDKNPQFYSRFGIKKEGLVLVRPDGHICFKSPRVKEKEIREYLAGTPLISRI